MAAKLVVLLVACARLAGASLPIPPYIRPCCVDQPNYKECCRQMGQEALRSNKYREGDPQYGMESVDPLKIDFMTSRVGGIQLNFTDVKIYGMTNLELKRADAFREPGNKRLEAEFLVHNMTFKSKYSIDGRVLLLSLKGRGDALINVENTTAKVVVPLRDKMIDGKNHVIPGKTTNLVRPGNVVIHLGNLFNGNGVLGETTNRLLNDNWRELLPIFDPFFNMGIAKATKAVLGGLSKYVAEEDIFPTTNCVTV